MTSHSRRNFSVTVFLNRKSKASRDQTAGVFQFAAQHDGWEIHLYSRPETPGDLDSLARSMSSPPSGIISGGIKVVQALRRKFRRRIPAVIVDAGDTGSIDADGFMTCDDNAIADKAADFFLSRGYESFAFAGIVDSPDGDPNTVNSDNRKDGFGRRLAKAGFGLSVYEEKMPPGACHYANRKRLDEWLKALAKPCALLACSDTIAQSVIDACRRARMFIPQQIAIIGIDNESTVCENTRPTLSSIEPDFLGGGYNAAAMLNEIMRRKKPSASTLRAKYGIAGFSERMSTCSTAGQRIRAARALDTIRQRALTGLTAKQLADEMGVTVRALELAFKAASCGTIRDAILGVRLKEAARLAKDTRMRADEIAARCGFRTASALKSIFKKRIGESMRSWRQGAFCQKQALGAIPRRGGGCK